MDMGTLITDKGVLSDASLIAQEFNDYFYIHIVPTRFHFKRVDEDTVLKLLQKLDTRKASSSDGISAKLLKSYASALASSVTVLFNASMDAGAIPSEWKEASLTQCLKGTNMQHVENFRPISMLPIIAKVYEGIIHDQLY